MSKEDKTLAKRGETAISRPDHLDRFKDDRRGTEHLQREDVKMPRLTLAQKMSPQMEKSDPKYIPGLNTGDLFNDLTSEIYGPGPINFTIVRADKPRAIEFIPMDEGGGIRDFNVPMNDPRTRWSPEGEKPVATVYYDYILALLPSREPVVLSLKSTQLKVAKQLNGLMQLRGLPCFTGLYELSTATKSNSQGLPYSVFQIRNAGYVDEETAAWGENVFEDLKDKSIEIVRENDDGDVVEAEVVSDKF